MSKAFDTINCMFAIERLHDVKPTTQPFRDNYYIAVMQPWIIWGATDSSVYVFLVAHRDVAGRNQWAAF